MQGQADSNACCSNNNQAPPDVISDVIWWGKCQAKFTRINQQQISLRYKNNHGKTYFTHLHEQNKQENNKSIRVLQTIDVKVKKSSLKTNLHQAKHGAWDITKRHRCQWWAAAKWKLRESDGWRWKLQVRSIWEKKRVKRASTIMVSKFIFIRFFRSVLSCKI